MIAWPMKQADESKLHKTACSLMSIMKEIQEDGIRLGCTLKEFFFIYKIKNFRYQKYLKII